jgi:hypothetical protein
MTERLQAILEGPGGALRLEVEGYEFPDAQDTWDANWLIISGEVVSGRERWRFRRPCLMTHEVRLLADWLDHLSVGQAGQAFPLTEPYLTFRRSDRSVCIGFALEVASPWSQRGDDLEACIITIPIDDRLSHAARALRAFAIRFPQRGGVS